MTYPPRLRAPGHARLFIYAALSNTQLQQGIFILYLLHRGLSSLQVSVLQAVLFVSVSLASVPVGILIDRVGARAAAGLGQFITSAVLFGQVLAPSSLVWFLLLFISHGVGLALKGNSELVFLYEAAAQSSEDAAVAFPVLRSRFTAVRAATVSIAIVIGGLIQPVSWTLVYVVSGSVTALSGVLATALLPHSTDGRASQDETPSAAPTDGPGSRWLALRAMGGSWALLLVVSSLMHGTLTPFLIFSQNILATQHVTTPAIAVTMAGVYTLGAVAPLLAPRVMRRLPTAGLASSTLTILAVGLLLTSSGIGGVTVVVVLVAASLPEITAISLDFAIQDRIASDHRGFITGVVGFFEAIAIAGAYLGFGALTEATGASHSAGVFAVLPVAALVFFTASRFLRPARVHTLDPDWEFHEPVHDPGVVETQL
jgi:MFS family permease